jgi:hypothetical protein
MRSIICILLIFCISNNAIAQNAISSIVDQCENFTATYEMTAAGGKVLYLPIGYGKGEFSYLPKEIIKSLDSAIIARVDLVYSDYPVGKNFSLLTRRRLEALQKILPDIFLRKNIEFRKLSQTAGVTKAVASGLQHGFFIYFRPLPTRTSGKEEAEKLRSLLADTSIHHPEDGTGVAGVHLGITVGKDTAEVEPPCGCYREHVSLYGAAVEMATA